VQEVICRRWSKLNESTAGGYDVDMFVCRYTRFTYRCKDAVFAWLSFRISSKSTWATPLRPAAYVIIHGHNEKKEGKLMMADEKTTCGFDDPLISAEDREDQQLFLERQGSPSESWNTQR